MPHYRVGGRSAATAATINHVACSFWNPHATARPRIFEVSIAVTTAGVANISLQRITTRGTPGSTVTPDIDNSDSRDIIPPSGALMDLAAFTAQPTLDASSLFRWNLPASIGAGVILPLTGGVTVPPGTGLAIITATAAAFPASDFAWVWEE